jgi:hypothetical protein
MNNEDVSQLVTRLLQEISQRITIDPDFETDVKELERQVSESLNEKRRFFSSIKGFTFQSELLELEDRINMYLNIHQRDLSNDHVAVLKSQIERLCILEIKLSYYIMCVKQREQQ